MSNIVGYVNTPGNAVVHRDDNGKVFMQFFNDTGADLNVGDVVVVEHKRPSTSGYENFDNVVITPATSAITVIVGVVSSYQNTTGVVKDDAIGYVQIEGYCDKITCKTADAIAINDYLKAENTVKTAATESTTKSAKSFAMARSTKAAATAGSVTGYLYGREVTI